MKKSNFIYVIALISLSVCIFAVFITALTVYPNAEPNNVTDIISVVDMNEYRKRFSEKYQTLDDLEAFPCVTKVYEYKTTASKLNIRYEYIPRNTKMKYSVVTDPSAEYNYRVECFVLSDIANKEFVKILWDISAQEDDVLTLTQTGAFKRPQQLTYNNLKKTDPQNDTIWYFDTYMRIIVKPGFDDIDFVQEEMSNYFDSVRNRSL